MEGSGCPRSSLQAGSLGVQDGADPEMLLRSADVALFDAKAAGRGVYRFHARDPNVGGAGAGYVRYRTDRVGTDA